MSYPEILKKELFKMKFSSFHWTLEIISILVILSVSAYIVINWSIIPKTIPVHFNLKGEPDNYGGKWTLILLPSLFLVIYSSMSLIGRYPHIYNYPFKLTVNNYKEQFRLASLLIFYLKIEITLLLSYLTFKTVRVALGFEDKLDAWSPVVFILVILFSVIFYFYRAYKAK